MNGEYIPRVKAQSEEEFIRDLMNDPQCGQFARIFVMEALNQYSTFVMQNKTAPIGQINPKQWKETAKHVHSRLTVRYKK